jgi:hypothetical protein
LLPDPVILHQGTAKSTIAAAYVVKIPCFDVPAGAAALAAVIEKSYKLQNIS